MNKKEFIAEGISNYLEQVLKSDGQWVPLTNSMGCFGSLDAREDIFNGVRQMLKLMKVHYSIPPQFPHSNHTRYGENDNYKIKLRHTKLGEMEKVHSDQKNLYAHN